MIGSSFVGLRVCDLADLDTKRLPRYKVRSEVSLFYVPAQILI